MDQKIRWGILGPGHIAHSFAKDLQHIKDAFLVAVASRNLDRAKAFAAEYGAPLAFGSYMELMECSEVDVIYIATPHTYHAELAIMAMEKGKHVLCEKPLGINREEVQRMVNVAREKRVFLMEALWSRFNPTIRKMKSLVSEGHIGDIGFLRADFAFYGLDRDEKGRILNVELAGGSLLDIGIYPIFLAYLLLGVPDRIMASSKFHAKGAEIQTSMIFDYPTAQALLYSGLTGKSEMKAEVSGSAGSLYLNPRWHEAQGLTSIKEGVVETLDMPTLGRGYTYEIMEVHHCLRQEKLQSDHWSHQNSLDLIGILDHVRKQTGSRFPFEH